MREREKEKKVSEWREREGSWTSLIRQFFSSPFKAGSSMKKALETDLFLNQDDDTRKCPFERAEPKNEATDATLDTHL